MSDEKLFSVIIPVYNGEKTIGRTLASLISNKKWIHEVIVVDDHSRDNTIEEVEKYSDVFPITILTSEGFHNPGVARKTGLLSATGEWITFVDADDCLTPSSLRYVAKYLDEENLVLLHTQTIYYESGSFVPDDIGHSDYSCGGNFYLREYLINNNLMPHNILRMAEDEYFNLLIEMFINHVDGQSVINYYDYPVYEVHHDFDDGNSFAIDNWVDYAIKYHLQCRMYLAQDLLERYGNNQEIYSEAKKELMDCFISSFMTLHALVTDENEQVNEQDHLRHFRRALRLFIKLFKTSKEELIEWYEHDKDHTHVLYEGVVASVGREFGIPESIADFINKL